MTPITTHTHTHYLPLPTIPDARVLSFLGCKDLAAISITCTNYRETCRPTLATLKQEQTRHATEKFYNNVIQGKPTKCHIQ